MTFAKRARSERASATVYVTFVRALLLAVLTAGLQAEAGRHELP
ncbi:hypothetical protein FB475_3692 [Kribbella jejuensis]|uniref:Uncharacterized protein n=1 Tax=Kribbella jejuensis TaxID=236068 RepID=A0A542EW12_9ACTN|nr:hypothetical protein FB475_3692 [Kribbella jejuensis]